MAAKQMTIYDQLTNAGGRDVWREKTKTFRSTYKVPFKNIVILEGWNARTIFENIEELANDLEINGQMEPMEGVLTPQGKFQLVDGERRYRAIELLRKRGVKWEEVEVIPVPKSLKPEDILVRMLSSGVSKSMFKAVEVANGLFRLKADFKLSNEEIGKRMGMSRQWVDNMIKLAKQPEEVKKDVAEGKIKKTDVVAPMKDKTTDVAAGLIKAKPQPGLPASLKTNNDKAEKEDQQNSNTSPGASAGESQQPAATAVSGKDALQGVNFDKEGNEQEAAINRIAKNVNKIESLGKGLNDQGQKDLENYLSWIRKDLTDLKEFYGKAKNKAVVVQ